MDREFSGHSLSFSPSSRLQVIVGCKVFFSSISDQIIWQLLFPRPSSYCFHDDYNYDVDDWWPLAFQWHRSSEWPPAPRWPDLDLDFFLDSLLSPTYIPRWPACRCSSSRRWCLGALKVFKSFTRINIFTIGIVVSVVFIVSQFLMVFKGAAECFSNRSLASIMILPTTLRDPDMEIGLSVFNWKFKTLNHFFSRRNNLKYWQLNHWNITNKQFKVWAKYASNIVNQFVPDKYINI